MWQTKRLKKNTINLNKIFLFTCCKNVTNVKLNCEVKIMNQKNLHKKEHNKC